MTYKVTDNDIFEDNPELSVPILSIYNKDRNGKRYGRLTIIGPVKYKNKPNYVFWMASCDCGNIVISRGNSLAKNKNGCVYCNAKIMYAINGPLLIARKTKPPGMSALNSKYLSYKHAAKSRNYKFELTKNELFDLVTKNCFYCGSTPEIDYKSHKNSTPLKSNGIDRLDNSLGYSVGNCVPCYFVCNRAKGTLTIPEFKEWMTKLLKYNDI